ncbi:subtilisin-like protease SBT1.6 [Nymphaea colorata]|uniref:subtilisin-like protease SBT1.6 n=1 Tax=Nymphaea colorata TaxID=210225 RepID=UPI00129D6FCF|nr:subtilisin-like protease SBT1.6 [Nymphaea colorata]
MSPLPLLLALFLCIAGALASGAGRKTFIFVVDHESKPSVFPTHSLWYASAVSDPTRLLHVYDTVVHGFSASVSDEEAAALRDHPSVLASFEDQPRSLHTTRSPQFLGLRNQHGLWSESDYGSDVIIGVLDTGIWPERRSFSDFNLGPVPARWRGACEEGQGFTAANCNRKVIGARFFSKGYEATAGTLNQTAEFRSPRDSDGHGSHTASTAAGRYVFQANMSGYASGVAKGVAPKSRLAVYKVCWKSGCFDSDILAAFDRAVADGVDVISVSIGGGSVPYYLDCIALGSFAAASKGVFVASSAGNEGPTGMSVTNLAPWITTVGAGTIDRNFPAEVKLGDGRTFSGVSLYSGKPLSGSMYPVVYPGSNGGLSASLCMEDSLDPNAVRGKIVLCDRGNNPRVAKGLVVKKAGGVGMILANGIANGEGLVGDAHVLPACTVGSQEGDAIKSYVASTPNPTATLSFGGTILGVKPAPVVASFSARGPNGQTPEILKPDLIAPGVNILAAWSDAIGPTGLSGDDRRTEFNILSGTSMACPHVAGAAALLKGLHPNWSPAAIRSALMTTARIQNNRLQSLTDESGRKASTPYDFGAGHVDLSRALDPGLVYDIGTQDYVGFLCSIGYGPRTIQVITKTPVSCPARQHQPEDLNYPSFAAVLDVSRSPSATKTFVRTVTNVGPATSVYSARVSLSDNGKGVTVSVQPAKLAFTAVNQKLSYTVLVTANRPNLSPGESDTVFGYVTWSDGGVHVVRSPIVVSRMQPF